jgi:exonuclease III
VLQLLNNCDILCLTETWLRPCELYLIDEILKRSCLNDTFYVFTKSSMTDTDASYTGRPFGGLAIICKKSTSFKFHVIDIPSDRIMCVCVNDNEGKPVQLIFDVYMPYYNSQPTQTELYIETVDILQSSVDHYGSLAPIQILGDFNVQLPNDDLDILKNKHWYKASGFNKHSLIMNDFLIANAFYVADHCFEQNSKFTYFNYKRNVFTWIDHIAISSHTLSDVISCCICNHEDLNTSDHLPIRMTIKIPLSLSITHKINYIGAAPTRPIKWEDVCKQSFLSRIKEKLATLPYISCPQADQERLDNYMNHLTSVLIDSVQTASSSHRKYYRPKPYWCPELSKLRDKKRFWWRMWVECDRPRSGAVFNCYKGAKKLFRRFCRRSAKSLLDTSFAEINRLFVDGRMTSFLRKLKLKKQQKVTSTLQAESFAEHFSALMNDTNCIDLSPEQINIKQAVLNRSSLLRKTAQHVPFTEDDVNEAILKLKRNVSPGLDLLTAEHFIFANCPELRTHLTDLYNYILKFSIIPNDLSLGVIIPILKKPTLNPNTPNNYRPITLGSIHCKLLEFLLMPEDDAHINQFGFRKGRGTSMACALLHDVIAQSKYNSTPLFVCSLDAEKCFDSLWHFGLFFKLMSKLPDSHWLFLYSWYCSMRSIVRWDNTYSPPFSVTRGTKQGSVLSPALFNIFIDDLLIELSDAKQGVRIGNSTINSFAYADDVTLMSSTAPDLQQLINICKQYADKWRFRFGIKKTHCMTVNGNIFKTPPRWVLGDQVIDNVDDMEILGCCFYSKTSSEKHVDKRIQSCRKSMFGLTEIGCCYPGLRSDVKIHLWKSIGQPTLIYGLDSMHVSKSDIKRLDSCQSSFIKRILGFKQRSHHSHLLNAVNVNGIEQYIKRNTVSLWKRAFSTNTLLRSVCAFNLAQFILYGKLPPGSLVHRIISFGLSPVELLFGHSNCTTMDVNPNDGVADSLRYLIMREQFLKPYSDEYILASLLVKAF